MRPCLILAAAALLASPLAAQPGRNHLWSSYDELESCTTVLAKVLARPAGKGRYLFELDARAMIRDSARTAPVEHVVFTAITEHDGDDERFGAEPALTIVLDDSVRLRYGGRYMRPFPAQHLHDGVMTRAWFWVPAADLRRMARASTVRGSTLVTDFTLAPREREALRQFSAFAARSPRALAPRPSRQSVTDCDSYPPPDRRRPSGSAARPPAVAGRVVVPSASEKERGT